MKDQVSKILPNGKEALNKSNVAPERGGTRYPPPSLTRVLSDRDVDAEHLIPMLAGSQRTAQSPRSTVGGFVARLLAIVMVVFVCEMGCTPVYAAAGHLEIGCNGGKGHDPASVAIGSPQAKATKSVARPVVVSRTSWGCPDGQNSPAWPPQYTTVTHLVVHHSAGGNSSADWAAVVRSIWSFHKYDNGWGDVGYNFLIAPNGVIYEGRAGGDNVIGAHFSCQNGNTFGVCILGTYTSVSPSAAALNSLKQLLAWKAEQRGIDPLGSTYHSGMRLTLANICGHKNANPASPTYACSTTVCPGDNLYALLPGIRTDVYNLIHGDPITVPTVSTQPATLITATSARIWGRIASDGGAPILERRLEWGAGTWSDFTASVTVSGNDFYYNLSALSPSTTYQFRAWARNSAGWAYSGAGYFTTSDAAPLNDSFVNRILVNGSSIATSGANINATKESGEANHAGNTGGKSVWWSWTALSAGCVTISTVGSSFDTLLGVYTGSSVSALAFVASDDDNGGGGTSLVNFNAVGGTSYRITVDGYNGASGNITLNVSLQADSTSPTVAISSPSPGQTFNTTPITVTGTAGDSGSCVSGVALVEVRVNSGSWQTASGTASWSRSVNLATGSNTIEARSRDNAGNHSSIASMSVNYCPPDTTAPTVIISSPTSAQTFNITPITVSGTGTDAGTCASGMAAVEVRINSGIWQAAGGTTAWSGSAALVQGSNTIEARSRDGAGNYSTIASVTVNYCPPDTTVPTVAISNPTSGQTFNTTPISVTGTAADAGGTCASGVESVEVRVNSGTWQAASGTTSWSGSAALLQGSNTIEARSRDGAGDYSTVASVSVSYALPNTAPNTPSNQLPTNGAPNQPLTLLLMASAFSDSDSGDTHTASQWLLRRATDNVVVFDSGEDSANKTSCPVPAGTLAYATSYRFQARFKDNRGGWSAYSPETAFTTLLPRLTVRKQGTNIVFTYPTNAVGFVLVAATNLTPNAVWTVVAPPPVVVSGQNVVTNSMPGSARFHRLQMQ